MIFRLLTAGLITFGAWQMGQGAYLLAKAELAQWLLEQAWYEMQLAADREQSVHDVSVKAAPWPWADTWPVAKMQWPELNQELVVLEGGSGRNLAFAPSHLSATVMPGEQGVSVIGGHRDTHFEFLQYAMIGDEFTIELADGANHRFQVKEIVIADVRESKIALDSSISKIALVACYPFTDWQAGSPLRYLVLADLVETKKTKKDEQVPPTSSKLLTTMVL